MNDCLVQPRTVVGRPFVAALAAGTIFMLAVSVSTGDVPVLSALALTVALSPFTTMFGFVLAVVPCLLGCAMLHTLGVGNAGARLPVFWVLIGGLAAGGVTAAVTADAGVITAFAATGATCALICRSGARWT